MRRQFANQFKDATVWEQFNQRMSVSGGNDPKHHSSSLNSREAILTKKKLFLSAARKKKWKTNTKILRFLWFRFFLSLFIKSCDYSKRQKSFVSVYFLNDRLKFLFKNRSRHRSAYRTIRKKNLFVSLLTHNFSSDWFSNGSALSICCCDTDKEPGERG